MNEESKVRDTKFDADLEKSANQIVEEIFGKDFAEDYREFKADTFN